MLSLHVSCFAVMSDCLLHLVRHAKADCGSQRPLGFSCWLQPVSHELTNNLYSKGTMCTANR